MRSLVVSLVALVVATPLAAQSTGAVHVCVAADRTMRVDTGPSCPTGQTSYNLVLAGAGGGAPPGEDKTAQVAELKKTIDFMQKRIDGLTHDIAALADEKTHPSGMKFMAPFEVVDKVGKTIFRVKDTVHGFEMVNPAGQIVLWASALDQGGVFKTQSTATYPEVVMGSVGDLGALVIRDGENRDRASLKVSNGKPVLALTNDNHVEIVSLGQGGTGGGRLALGVASGESAVLAGVTTGGKCGRVDAYPTAGSGRSMVGAAPTFILGAGKC